MASPSSSSSSSSSTTTTTAAAASTTATITTMKLKTLLQTLIFSHMYRIARALTKAKSFLIQIIKDMDLINSLQFPLRKNKHKKLFFGSFRLHYNWCSSSSSSHANKYVYYDSSWNYVVPTTSFECHIDEMQDQSSNDNIELSKYLQWLEEKGNEDISAIDEIDKLADLFIANCHEKFLLEKQESYRRYQEMMARSV